MKMKRYSITSKNKSPILNVFDKYISLFSVPLFVFIYAVIFIQTNGAASWEGLIAGIWILFAIIASLVLGAFFLANRFWLRWQLNWWKNILISLLLFVASSFLFGMIIRLIN